MRKVFLDMDPGVDDALAIMMGSVLDDLEVVGISTVAGNVDVRKTTANALKLTETLGLKTKVYRGASRPLLRPYVGSEHVHGRDGLGEVGLPPPTSKEDGTCAPEAIIQAARAEGKKLHLVATGPLTNIAMALMLEPDLPSLVGEFVIMGGAFGLTACGGGNVTKFSEYNIWADPEAARAVFESFDGMVAVGLDVTMDPAVLLSSADMDSLPRTGRGALARQMAGFVIRRFGFFAPHDPLALYHVSDPSVLKLSRMKARVLLDEGEQRGRTLAEPPGDKGWAMVASGVDGRRFKEAFLGSLG
ncbi:MAG: nucleoside hydrolase [Nitrososphaerota archaeon]|nr:nucleoside hydrolase [Nitrososphaerota archaeon]